MPVLRVLPVMPVLRVQLALQEIPVPPVRGLLVLPVPLGLVLPVIKAQPVQLEMLEGRARRGILVLLVLLVLLALQELGTPVLRVKPAQPVQLVIRG